MRRSIVHEAVTSGGDGSTLSVVIGQRVRQERHARGYTLDQLASAAKVSRRMLINVEQGVANPSVGTLLKLSDALAVGLPALVALPQHDPVQITRRGEAAPLWTSPDGGQGVMVVGSTIPDALELWDWTLAPGDEYASAAHGTGTREILQVWDGTVTVRIGDRSIALDAGDAVAFPSDCAHAYANRTDRPARFALVVFEPAGAPSVPHAVPRPEPRHV